MTIVWVLLVVALLATLIGCGVMLVRRFVRLLEASAELIGTSAILDAIQSPTREPREQPAVLQPRALMAARQHELARLRAERKHQRSLARLERARALISAKPWR